MTLKMQRMKILVAKDKNKYSPEERLKTLEDKIAKLERELNQMHNVNQKLQKRVQQAEKRNMHLNQRVETQNGTLQQITAALKKGS